MVSAYLQIAHFLQVDVQPWAAALCNQVFSAIPHPEFDTAGLERIPMNALLSVLESGAVHLPRGLPVLLARTPASWHQQVMSWHDEFQWHEERRWSPRDGSLTAPPGSFPARLALAGLFGVYRVNILLDAPKRGDIDATCAAIRCAGTPGLELTFRNIGAQMRELSLIHISEPTRPY